MDEGWLACYLVALFAACSNEDKALAPPLPKVVAMQVIQRTATVIGDLVGEVRAFRQIELRPQTTGLVQEILFEPGQRVKLNQVLFAIDPQQFEASLTQTPVRLYRALGGPEDGNAR